MDGEWWRKKWVAWAAAAAIFVVLMLVTPAIPQDKDYHDFADQRVLFLAVHKKYYTRMCHRRWVQTAVNVDDHIFIPRGGGWRWRPRPHQSKEGRRSRLQRQVPKIGTPPPDRPRPAPWQQACPPTPTLKLSGRYHHDLAAQLVEPASISEHRPDGRRASAQ
ncbi:hypothetical protein CFC21_071274 [Triticum aestivum]|uniref:Uncharacterized protein n=3 Tax=Triticum TaxID=4564 RepID=A0A9R1AKN7_TRITD|nr:hypothetical protein CFC21_071274 [Triticum aestivum]VAI31420.1 unnamed protein product [Triticum turgidum subsp. durum]